MIIKPAVIKSRITGKLPFLLSVIIIFTAFASVCGQSITVYENADFTGRSQTFGIGDHKLSGFGVMRLPTRRAAGGLDNSISSVKVPGGLIALVYENAEANGGSGIWVDLMEDHADLSPLGFDNKISYIKVFSSPDARKFIWARNSLKNGQFVPGHWERPRAGGNPVNSTAIAAPPLAPPPPRGPTAIQVNDAQSIITFLGVQAQGDAPLWETAEAEGMGIIGSDYRGIEEIGSAAFERASNNLAIPDNINFWFPQKQPRDHRNIVYYKRTLSGIVDAEDKPYIVDISGTYQDHDMTFNTRPFPKYQYLIKDGHKPEQATIQALKTLAAERENPYGDCDKPFEFVHSEIDARTEAKNQLNTLIRGRANQQISAYGVWIYDKGHCHHPEIHPAEQIWWSHDIGVNRIYNLNVFCDSSGRFWWRHQMDDGTKIKPWGAPPITGVYALTFEAKIDQPTVKFEVSNIAFRNVAFYPDSNKIYNLVYQNKTLISFNPKNDAFKVSYEKVGLKPGTTDVVRGFLVIETSVGKVAQIATRVDGRSIPPGTDPNDAAKVPEDIEDKAFKKEDGYYLFKVLRSLSR